MYTFIRIQYLSCIPCRSVSLYTLQRKYRLSQDTGMPISPNYGTEKIFTHIDFYLPGATRLAIECNMDETTTKLIMLR